MLAAAITAWLTASDDYDAGLVLLRQSGRCSAFLLTMLHKGDDAYNRKRLADELEAWLATAPSTPAPLTVALDYGVSTVPMVVTTAPTRPTPAASTADGPAVAALKQQVYHLMNERAELKARLRAGLDAGNDEPSMAGRLPLALQIKTITRQIDEIMSQVEFQAQHGYLPLPANADPGLLVDDTAALLNARSYVSRYKAKLKKKTLTPEQRQSAQVLLTQYEAEKQRLTLKLNKTAMADGPEHLSHDFNPTGQQTPDCRSDPSPFS